MKNEFHLAYRTSFNFPLHIASPDSVREHIKDKVRLISMLPAEFPKVRGRDVINAKIISTTMRGDVKVQLVEIDSIDGAAVRGYLLNDKYYFSSDVAGKVPSFQLLFKSFKENDIKPMVRREWNWDYPSSNPFWYTLVDAATEEYFNVEHYHAIDGYDELNIDCLADLLAYSYKFTWSHVDEKFEAVNDAYEITKRIRKPWMSHLVQMEYGEAPHTTADSQKLINFLLQKTVHLMTTEEQDTINTFLDNTVTLETLQRLNARNDVLQKILKAYNSPTLITQGCDIEADPLIFYTIHKYEKRDANV